MSFRDNLQHLRATHAMTRSSWPSCLASAVSPSRNGRPRSPIPKWIKLLKLCQIFDVTLDDLVQGDLTTSTPHGRCASPRRYSARGPLVARLKMCAATTSTCAPSHGRSLGAWVPLSLVWHYLWAVAAYAEAAAPSLAGASLIPLFAGIAIGLGLIVTAAIQHTEFQRSHPFIQDFYTVEDRQRTQASFRMAACGGHRAHLHRHCAHGYD